LRNCNDVMCALHKVAHISSHVIPYWMMHYYKLTPQLMFKFCTAFHPFPSRCTSPAKFLKFCQRRLPFYIVQYMSTRWMYATYLFDNFRLVSKMFVWKNDVFVLFFNVLVWNSIKNKSCIYLSAPPLYLTYFLMIFYVFFYHNTPGGF
jgi:hypothetical protein